MGLPTAWLVIQYPVPLEPLGDGELHAAEESEVPPGVPGSGVSELSGPEVAFPRGALMPELSGLGLLVPEVPGLAVTPGVVVPVTPGVGHALGVVVPVTPGVGVALGVAVPVTPGLALAVGLMVGVGGVGSA